ncbi:MAG: HEAT repeat domain-containing protein [Methanoregula sp.]|jgi:HEAT repeat protein|uniref:HEAT repeat domain-containing protein n=1 Tax=Methanoregula sp. TaxID=2052170 RepID=UPI003C13945E
MDLSVEKPDVEWYNSFPRKGAIYDLAYAAVSGSEREERLRAVGALGKSGDPRAVRPLMDLAADSDPEIRSSVISALGCLKSGRSVEVLIGCLRDRDEQAGIRQDAAAALAAIRSTGAIRGLKEFIADEGGEDAEIRSAAKDILNSIGTW